MRKAATLISMLFVFTIPWEGVVEFPGLGTGARLLGFALVAFWIVTVGVTGKFRKPGPFQITTALFVLWNSITIFWSGNPSRTMTHIVTWIQLLGMVFILWDLYTTRETILAGLQAFVLGAYVAIGITVYNFFTGEAYYSHYQRFSPSEQSNPDGFGFMIALSLPVALYLATTKQDSKMSGLLKFVNYAYVPAVFFGLALSGTRTALIASIPGVAFGLASTNRLRVWVRVAVFLLLTAAILVLLPQVQSLRSFQRFSTIGSELREGDLNQRTGLWSEGLEAFAEHPLTGVGSNMYRSVNSLGKLAHNSFISVLVETGLIGFVLFGVILSMAFLAAWRQPIWVAGFWLTMLMVWAIGASSLSYEFRKATWLLLSLLVASASLCMVEHPAEAPVSNARTRFSTQTAMSASGRMKLQLPKSM